MDSQNDETFGDVSDSIANKSFTDFTSGKSNSGPQLPSSFSTMVDMALKPLDTRFILKLSLVLVLNDLPNFHVMQVEDQSSRLSTSNNFQPSGSLDSQSRFVDWL